MPFSYCPGVPSLVSLAQNFTNSDDPAFIKFSPWHVLLLLPSTGKHNDTCPPNGPDGSRSLSPVRSLVWAKPRKRRANYVHVLSTCNVHCTVCFKSIANTSPAVAESLRSPRSPLPAPAARMSSALWGREGSVVSTEIMLIHRAGPVTHDCR